MNIAFLMLYSMVISSLSQNMNFCVVTSSLSPKTELITDASTLCFQLTAGHSQLLQLLCSCTLSTTGLPLILSMWPNRFRVIWLNNFNTQLYFFHFYWSCQPLCIFQFVMRTSSNSPPDHQAWTCTHSTLLYKYFINVTSILPCSFLYLFAYAQLDNISQGLQCLPSLHCSFLHTLSRLSA